VEKALTGAFLRAGLAPLRYFFVAPPSTSPRSFAAPLMVQK
jgi:hypothetical protein